MGLPNPRGPSPGIAEGDAGTFWKVSCILVRRDWHGAWKNYLPDPIPLLAIMRKTSRAVLPESKSATE